MTNCPNCGAQIEPYKCHCDYCNSYYFDFAAFDCSKKCFVKFKVNNGKQDAIITALAIPTIEAVEYNSDMTDVCDCCGTIINRIVTQRTCDLKATFSCVTNPEDGSLFKLEKI